jgi:hypothetical protein
MTAFMLENAKLIMLFVLIGSVIGLSHLSGENLPKIKHEHGGRRWCVIGMSAKTLTPAHR